MTQPAAAGIRISALALALTLPRFLSAHALQLPDPGVSGLVAEPGAILLLGTVLVAGGAVLRRRLGRG